MELRSIDFIKYIRLIFFIDFVHKFFSLFLFMGSSWVSFAFSPYYCLDGYRTMNPYQNSSRKFQPPYDIMSVQAWFRIIVEKRWKRINLINFDKPGESNLQTDFLRKGGDHQKLPDVEIGWSALKSRKWADWSLIRGHFEPGQSHHTSHRSGNRLI